MRLESFEIIGLNSDQNIKINFVNNRKILIAENGSGKTTILNMLYYCLKYDLNKLNKFLFDECRLVFNPSNQLIIKKSELNKIDDGNIRFITQPMEVSKNDLEKSYLILQALNTIADYMFSNSGTMAFHNFLVEYLSNIYRHETKKNRYGRKSSTNLIDLLLKNNIKLDDNVILSIIGVLSKVSEEDLNIVYNTLDNNLLHFTGKHYKYSTKLRNPEFINKNLKINLMNLIDAFKERNSNLKSNKDILEKLKFIYLPTYRRIENNLEDLFSDKIALKEGTSISFGLEDINSLFQVIKKKIEDFLEISLSQLNQNILENSLSNKHDLSKLKIEIENDSEYISKVLAKVGKKIKKNDKNKIIQLLKKDEISNTFIWLYMTNLSDIYKKSLQIESEIIKFIDLCNKYLENKMFSYDEENLTFDIKIIKKTNITKNIDLSSLSSGEKQIISIFAKLYLLPLSDLKTDRCEKEEGYWIIFDEPEISLSLTWQRMLLIDIWNSGKCDFLFATTHSPFIFDNEFKYYTSHIKECIEEI